jgi:hypothetical protein
MTARFNTLLAALLVVSVSAFAPALGELLTLCPRTPSRIRPHASSGVWRSFELHATLFTTLLTRRFLQMSEEADSCRNE